MLAHFQALTPCFHMVRIPCLRRLFHTPHQSLRLLFAPPVEFHGRRIRLHFRVPLMKCPYFLIRLILV